MSAPSVYLVTPCYNEEEVLPLTIQTLSVKMKQLIARQRIAENSRILFVNDGSKDKTWQLIKEAHEQESLCAGLDLTRNRGHQNALLAGLMSAMPYADITAVSYTHLDVYKRQDQLRSRSHQKTALFLDNIRSH